MAIYTVGAGIGLPNTARRCIVKTSLGKLVLFAFTASSTIKYKTSSDGGQTWDSSWTSVVSGYYDFDVVIDASNNIHMLANTDDQRPHYIKLTYSGGSWTVGGAVELASGISCYSTNIMILDNGNIVAGWRSGITAYWRTSTDGGATWGGTSAQSVGTVWQSEWLAYGNTVSYFILTGNLLCWGIGGSGVTIDTGLPTGFNCNHICAVRKDNNNIWIAYRTSSGIAVKKWNGSAWDVSRTMLSDHANDTAPSIQIFNGQPVVSWVDYDGTNYDIAYRKFDGTNWETQVDVTSGAEVDGTPNMIFSEATYLLLGYYAGGNIKLEVEREAFDLTDAFNITDEVLTKLELDEPASLSDEIEEFFVPSVRNVEAFQRTSDGKVEIDYEVFFNHFLTGEDQVDIQLQYWNGTTWQNCTTTVGEGSKTLIAGEWVVGSAVWDAKADINGTYYSATKIKVLAGYSSHYGFNDSPEFALDVKNPVVTLLNPSDGSSQYLLPFVFETDIVENSSYHIKFQFSASESPFVPIIEHEDDDIETWDYTENLRPLMFGQWFWRIIVEDIYHNETTSAISDFTLLESATQIRIDSLQKYYNGSGMVKVLFSLRDLNNEKVSIRFDYTTDEGLTYHPVKVVSVSSGTISPEEDYITNLSATPVWIQYNAELQYATDTEMQLITDELMKKNLRLKAQVIVTRDDINYDISDVVSKVDIARSKQFGSSQANIGVIDKDFKYNPINESSEVNLVGSAVNPLIYFGNKIRVIHHFLTNTGVKLFTKFTGIIKNVEISKSGASNGIQITAMDNLQKLINYMPNNLEYKTTKRGIVNEILRTFDGVTYFSEHTSWADYPAPIIYLNGTKIEPDKYIIDFVRGQVIYKGNALSKLTTDTKLCTNPSTDRKTWVTGIEFNDSILPKVYYVYEKYERFNCNDYTGWIFQWTGYTEELHEFEDYYIDYTNGNVNLYLALPADNPSSNEGNINNQSIMIVYRQTTTLKATYSYEVEGSNEVEDIIKDLAIRAGIESADMQRAISGEFLLLRDSKYLYTKKNNLISFALYRNGGLVSSADYNLDLKAGKVTLKTLDYNDKNKILDDCDYLWEDAGAGVVQSREGTVKREGTHSLKVEFPITESYLTRDLLSDLYNTSVGSHKFLEFYIKGESSGTVYFEVSYDNSHWETKEVTINTDWQLVSWDVSGFSEVFKDIKYLRVRGTNVTVYLDYIYLKRNLYTCNYTYWTLQATEITLSKAELNYENTENAFQGIQNLLKNVAPNYIVYIDEENKFMGYYSSQQLFKNSVTCWSNFMQGGKGYSRSYYGEYYQVTLPKNLVFNISDEEVYTGVLVIGKNTEPQNVALKGLMTDVCAWVSGKGYGTGTKSSSKAVYDRANKPMIVGGQIIFEQLAQQNSEPAVGGAGSMNDFDTSTGMFWYKVNTAPQPNQLMCELELDRAILWDRIDILVGSYDSKVIKEAMVIQVGDEFGNYWYTEKNMLKVQGGATGSWVTFENNFNQNIKIKFVRVYCSEPWSWTVTTTTSGGKKGGASVDVTYHYTFSIAEIEVWERSTLISEARLDNCLLVGDGVTTEVYLPNTPFKTKDYLESKWGWIEKYPETIILYKNSFNEVLVVDTDYTYDKTTGLVSFFTAPEKGDIICGTWTLDEVNPQETTFYASFANKDILKRIGIKLYKEVDEGLYTHQQCIYRAKSLLPEMIRSIYPSTLEVVYRPDVTLGQSILLVNEELSLRRIFYIDSINLNIDRFIPTLSLGLTSFLELKDYEYQETAPDIYRDWKIYYPQYIPAYASYTNKLELPPDASDKLYFTANIAVEAMDDNGEVKADYAQECVLDILTLEDSTSFVLAENRIKADMWKDGRAELSFFIQWNRDGKDETPKIPDEISDLSAPYIDKLVNFKLYESDNPLKSKTFSTRVRLYLYGSMKVNKFFEAGNLGLVTTYNDIIKTTETTKQTLEGKEYATDIFNTTSILGADANSLLGFISNGQTIYALVQISTYYFKVRYYDWFTSSWIDWGDQFYAEFTPSFIGVLNGKVAFWRGVYNEGVSFWDGKTLVGASIFSGGFYRFLIFNNKLYAIKWRFTSISDPAIVKIYNENAVLEATYSQVLPSDPFDNDRANLFVHNGVIYNLGDYDYYGSHKSVFCVWKWDDTAHTWSRIYKYEINTKEPLRSTIPFDYKGKTYFILYGSQTTGVSGWFLPMLCEYNYTDNKIYRVAYLVNADWGYEGSRETPVGARALYSQKFVFQSNVYLVDGNLNVLNITHLLTYPNREEVLENQI